MKWEYSNINISCDNNLKEEGLTEEQFALGFEKYVVFQIKKKKDSSEEKELHINGRQISNSLATWGTVNGSQ